MMVDRKDTWTPKELPSSALISNTLICEASRLGQAEERWPKRFHAREKDAGLRLFDLFSTIEAAVLYRELYTLPARLDLEGEQLALRERLLEAGVLRELDLSDDHQRLAGLVTDALKQVENPVAVAGSANRIGQPVDYEGKVRSEIQRFLDFNTDGVVQKRIADLKKYDPEREFSTTDISTSLPANVYDTIDYSASGGRSSEILEAENFQEFGRALIGWIEYGGSGSYEFCTSILRDMYYIYVAELKGIPYWPQSTRVEFARSYPNFMDRGVRTKLYARFAKELGASLAEVREVFGARMTFIPPFTAMVLDRSTTPADIPEQVLKIRHEFMWLRDDMDTLEREMNEATTFGQMQKVARKQLRLSESIAERFQRKESVWIERGFKYIPELAKPALSPADPTKYGAGLLLQPIEWLIDVIRTRPIALFFDAKSKVDSISGYQDLISKVFKLDVGALSEDKLRWYFPDSPTASTT